MTNVGFAHAALKLVPLLSILLLIGPQGALAQAPVAQTPAEAPAQAPASATPQPSSGPSVAAVSPAADQKKGAAAKAVDKAVDKVEDIARSITEIFRRVPCSGPKSGTFLEGSLPNIGRKLAAGQPVTIVAFGSSSTVGYGVTSAAFTYPNRLADQLRRKYPRSDITVLNRGIGGEDTPEMMKRLQTAVLDARPDLVIWQFGTNAIIRGDDTAETEKLVLEGIARMRAANADVVLIDPQYAPAVTAKPEGANKMVQLMRRIAHLERVGLFPRFAVMKDWHDRQANSFSTFTFPDGLHMNDWGYACFAQLLGDTIIESVSRVQAGIEPPQDVLMFRPM